ncbi:MAG: class I SAM-dependent methyltransferase [Roseivirga sp.]
MSCVACDSPHIAEAFTARDINDKCFRFLSCSQCGTLQISEFDDHLLAYAYDSGYYGGSEAKFKWPFSAFFDWGKQMAAKEISRLIDNKNASILDIGCGKGDLLDKLHQLGHTALWGNDIEKPENLPAHIHWISGTFPELDSIDKKFDLITLIHVFEHLPAPAEIIKQLHLLAQPGGLVVLSLPNIQSKQARKYQAAWLHLDPPRHLHLVPPQQLKKMFTAAGFRLVSETYSSPLYNPYGYLQSWLNKRIAQRDLLYEFLKKKGHVRGPKQFFQLLCSFLFAGISFPFYFLTDRAEAKNGQSGTVEFVFEKK